MKKFKLFKLLALFVVLITSINSAWATTYTITQNQYFYFDKTLYPEKSSSTMDFTDAGAILWLKIYGGTAGEKWYEATHINGNVYGVKITDTGTFTGLQIARKNPNGADAHNANSNDVWTYTAAYTDFGTTNNYRTASGWGYYRPNVNSFTLTASSFDNLGGAGTSENPYKIPVGTTVTFTASSVSRDASDDSNMELYYEFNENNTTPSKQKGTTASYTYTATTTPNTNFNMMVYVYNRYQSGDGNNASRQIYFKTVGYYVAGNGSSGDGYEGDAWCDGEGWNNQGSPMTYDATNSDWYITFDNVPASSNLKFAITDGSWDNTWRHSEYNSSCSTNLSEEDAGDNDHNAKLTITNPSNITIRFNPSASTGSKICASAVALYNNLAVAINDANAATTPTISAEYTTSDAPVTVTAADANPGYTWSGWTANGGTFGNSSLQQTTWSPGASSKTATANYTENNYDVTITKTTGGTLSSESTVTGHKTTSANLPTANAYPGYRFVNWTVTSGTADITNATSASSATINNMTDDVTVQANFARTYAFIEGRFHVTNAARDGNWTNSFTSGDWASSSTQIKFDYDDTNHRFYRHTYAQPAELTSQISSRDPVFYIKTSTAENSISGETNYKAPNANTYISAAGSTVALSDHSSGSTNDANLRFNSSDESGYAVLYFDQTNIWYQLEQYVEFDGNGNTGGSAPAGRTYYLRDETFSAPTNTYERTGYTFTGWNTQFDGNGDDYDEGDPVTVGPGNITLYAQWSPNEWTVTLDFDGGYSGVATTSSEAVAYGTSTNLTSAIEKPLSLAFLFQGYYTEPGGAGVQLIDKDGNWLKDVSGYTNHDGDDATWIYNNNLTLYAKWTKYYSLVHSPALTGEGAGSVYVTYHSSTLDFTAAHRTGHTCDGYYTTTNAEGGGRKVITAEGALYYNGVGDTIVNSSNEWIYTKYLNDGWIYPHWTAKTYTITFNANDGSCVGNATNIQPTVSVTYKTKDFHVGEDPVSTVAIPTLTGYTFGGYYADEGCGGYPIVDAEGNWQSNNTYLDSDGNWKYVLADAINLYAKWTANTVKVTYDAGTNGGYLDFEEGEPLTITADESYGDFYDVNDHTARRVGYEFQGWYTAPSGGTRVTNATRITDPNKHTLYAQYLEISYVYFYNNLGWTEVWVTYDATWRDDQGAGNSGKTYRKMEKIGESNIWRDRIPEEIIRSWKFNIAFNSKQNGSTPVGDHTSWNSGSAVFRRDFDSYATMFVPCSTRDYNKNGCDYYSTDQWTDVAKNDKNEDYIIDYRYKNGYWTRYNDNYSGYVIKGSWDSSHDYYFTRSYSEPTDTSTVTLHLNASTSYTFQLYKHCKTSNHYSSWFTKNADPMTITSSSEVVLSTEKAGEHNGYNTPITLTTTVEGDYTFKLITDKSGYGLLKLSVVYPKALEARDHRLVYTWNDGSSHTWISPAKLIPVTARTPMSAFIHKPSNVTSNSLKLQRWNGSAWEDAYIITLTDELITKNGVYYLEPNRVSGTIESVKVEPYTGKYFLRTDATGGGWHRYRDLSFGDNSMTYSAYSLTQTLSDPYSHFYCIYVDNTNTSVAFTVATEWTESITDTMTTDSPLVTDTHSHLPEAANVRFMWNNETNELHRAYLKSAQGSNARFLVLKGTSDPTRIFKSNGDTITASGSLYANELQFVDKGDWIYEVDLQANPGSTACITAKFNEADRYLVGNGSDKWENILGGEYTTTKYTMKGIYDYKTNRLMMMWTPSDTINDHLEDVDMLWIRHGNTSATQINLGTGSLTDVTVVGALEFQYDELIGKVSDWDEYSRPLMKFMLSFPFDVNVSDIFGLNGAVYGREYVIQTYNGAKRAEKGYYSLDGDYWEDLTVDSVMHANQGYSVIMDNDYLNNASKSIWEHKEPGSSIYLYFPAKSKMDIPKNSAASTVKPHLSFDKPFAGGTKNHKDTDSHWNMIGSPLFHDSYVEDSENEEEEDAKQKLNAYYAWSSDDNTWGVETASFRDPYDLDGSVGFPAMSSIIVQWHGTITWSTTATDYLRPAPRRANEEAKNYLARLELIHNNKVTDKAFVQMNDGATKGYALCEDLNKIMNGNKSNIYLFADNYEVAYSQVPVQTDTIPVGLIIRRTGTYTFSMPLNFSGTITLLDTYANTRTNLTLEDYEVELNRGTINDRFFLVIDVNQAPTAIDGVGDGEGQGSLKDGKAHKFIMNGMMYILENGNLYDARGNRVK